MREGGRQHRGGLHAGLISAPQNDLRHTLHVGYDGAVFGDVALIGQDHLPAQTTVRGVKLRPRCNVFQCLAMTVVLLAGQWTCDS